MGWWQNTILGIVLRKRHRTEEMAIRETNAEMKTPDKDLDNCGGEIEWRRKMYEKSVWAKVWVPLALKYSI